MSDQPLDGAVALVTGASSGIGAATARRLAQEGAVVALVARRRERLDEIVGEIASLGGHAVAVEADITQPERAESAVNDTLDRFGRLDVLVNNAGIMLLNSALHTTVEEWDRMISLNVAALAHVTHAAIPYLIDAAVTSPRQVADLVNVSSTAGRVARAGSSVYNLTATGLLSANVISLRRRLEPSLKVDVYEVKHEFRVDRPGQGIGMSVQQPPVVALPTEHQSDPQRPVLCRKLTHRSPLPLDCYEHREITGGVGAEHLDVGLAVAERLRPPRGCLVRVVEPPSWITSIGRHEKVLRGVLGQLCIRSQVSVQDDPRGF